MNPFYWHSAAVMPTFTITKDFRRYNSVCVGLFGLGVLLQIQVYHTLPHKHGIVRGIVTHNVSLKAGCDWLATAMPMFL